MRRHSNIIAACLMTLSTALAGLGCGSDNGGTPAACTALTTYTASTTTPVSFAADVYPILANTDVNAFGCAQASCHGITTPIPITMGGRILQFVFNPPDIPMAKASLTMASVNLPAMPRVTPSNVGNSMLAYKISGEDGLACLNSRCTAGASVGTAPCGDPMPTAGTLSAADRTKILDWIAQGAAD